jgi:hypothetical protein
VIGDHVYVTQTREYVLREADYPAKTAVSVIADHGDGLRGHLNRRFSRKSKYPSFDRGKSIMPRAPRSDSAERRLPAGRYAGILPARLSRAMRAAWKAA